MNVDLPQDIDEFLRIFCPGDLERLHRLESETRLVYYTNAETAKSIVENKEIWFRNALLMNDFSEIQYGLKLMSDARSKPAGVRLRQTASELFPGVIEQSDFLLEYLKPDWRLETYLSCWSLHDPAEDQTGRLSMWRAYGDVALVLRNQVFHAFGEQTGIESLPVNYFSLKDYEEHLEQVRRNICNNTESILKGGKHKFEDDLSRMAFATAMRTKHPGFREEDEWRVWFRPTDMPDPMAVLAEKVVVIDGVPQNVWVLPLRDDPEKGLRQADMGSLLDRIILGPTAYPYVSARAFVALLEKAGVPDAANKVVVSDIPLRANPTGRSAF